VVCGQCCFPVNLARHTRLREVLPYEHSEPGTAVSCGTTRCDREQVPATATRSFVWWNVLNLAALIWVRGRWVDRMSVVRSFLPFAAVGLRSSAVGCRRRHVGPAPCRPTRSDEGRGKSTAEIRSRGRLGRQRADGRGWSFFLARWPHVFSLLLLVIGVSAEQLVDTGWLPGWRSEHPPHALTRKMQEGRFGWSAGSGHSDSSGVRNRKPGGFHGVNQTRRSRTENTDMSV
jgi:hypothetical protein